MNRTISVLIIVILLFGFISGCSQEVENPAEELQKPEVTPEDFISQLEDVRGSMNDIEDSFSE